MRDLADFLRRVPLTGGVRAVVGDLGVGKTALLQAAVEAGPAECTVVWLGSHPDEVNVAGAGLRHVAMALTSHIVATAAHPADGDWLRPASAGDSLTSEDVSRLLSRVVAELGPLLLVWDDVQWIDTYSLDILVAVCRSVSVKSLGLLLAGRSLPHDALTPDDILPLEPLSAEASKDLLLDHLHTLGPLLTARILREVEGYPAGLTSMADTLSNARVTMEELLAPRLPLGGTLQENFSHVLRGLTGQVRDQLLLVAVAGTDREDVLGAAADEMGLGPLPLRDAEAQGLLSRRQGTVTFCHPLLRSAVYWAAPSAHRRKVHAALSRVLASDAYAHALHSALASAVPDEVTAATLEAGVADHVPEAAAVLHLAADLSPRKQDADRRLLKAAQAAEVRDQTAYLRHLLTRFDHQSSVDRTTSAIARALQAHLAYKSDGVPAHAMDMLMRHEDVLTQWPPPFLPLAVALAPVLCELPATDMVRVRLDAMATEYATRMYSPGLIAVLSWHDRDKYAARARRLLKEADRSRRQGTLEIDSSQAAGYVVMATAVVDPVRAVSLGEHVLKALIDRSHFGTARVVLAHLQIAGIHLGDPQAVTAGSGLGRRWTRSVDDPRATEVFRVGLAHVMAWEGREEGHESLTDEILAFSLPRRLNLLAARARWARGLMALSQGRPEEAYEELRRIYVPEGDVRHPVVFGWAVGDLTQAAVAAGKVDAVRPFVHEAAATARHLKSPLLEHLAARSLALLSDDEHRTALFERSLAVPGAEAFTFEFARTQLAYGEWLRRCRRVLEARPALRDARKAFESMGATAWARRAQSELLAAGEAAVASPLPWTTKFGLTPREAEVVQLAAAGLSNRSISWQLGLTQRTVASHLSRVFAKVGVGSRKQLPRLMQELAGEADPGVR